MPYTLNGIGTMYYGKKNLMEYEGVCENCRRTGWLSAYETRLWVTIIFIPIIPLEQKQIIDYCPSCSSHRAMSLEQWLLLKEQSPVVDPGEHGKADSASHVSHESDDSNEAIENHLTVLHAGNDEEADSLAREMELKFSKSLDVQHYLASYYLRRKKDKEAQAVLERVLQLDPDDQWARRHVGIACLRRRNLSRARQLLSYLLKSHTNQDAGVLLELATALWEAQRYSEAYVYFEVIARDFKSIASNNRKYRRMVKDTETRTASPRSILPRSAAVKGLAVAGIVVVALLGILLIAQAAVKQRTLHVVNGLPAKATLSIPGKKPLVVRPSDRSSIVLKEGEYKASVKIKNRPDNTVKFTLSDGFWARLINPSIFVFNIEGAAVIVWEKVRYRERPSTDDPYHYRFYVGEPFIKIKKTEVNYLFADLPEKVTLSSSEKFTDKTRLGIVKGKPEHLIGGLITTIVPPNNTMTYLESHLQIKGERENLLNAYAAVGGLYFNTNRCVEFLEKGLSRRPVMVDWHRVYQGLKEGKGESKQLFTQYDTFLEQEPGNSALLYLRGRLAKNTKEVFTYYDKAIAADPKNPFPYFAKSFHLACRGDFAAAGELSQKACALHPGDHSMKDRHYDLRFALGEFETLELEMMSRVEGAPINWDYFRKLMEVRVAQNKIAGAKKALKNFKRALKLEYKEESSQVELEAQLLLDYLLKDFDAMEKHLAGLKDETDRNDYLKTVYFNRGDMEKLEALPEDIAKDSDGYLALLYWLGWMEKGNPQKASTWLMRAKEYFLASTDHDTKQVGHRLEKPGPGITAQLDVLSILPESKCILYAVFSRLYHPGRKRLLARAEKMNYLPRFPYHFLKKIINN